MSLLKLVAQFLVVLVIGYVVAVAMACAIGSSCPFQGLRPSKPTSTGSWRSAPSASHYAPITEEMEHGVQTVRTVIETKDGLDRTAIGRVQSKANHR